MILLPTDGSELPSYCPETCRVTDSFLPSYCQLPMKTPDFSYENALVELNQQLLAVGLPSISERNFCRIIRVFKVLLPNSRWIAGGRLIYSKPVLLLLYFLCRLHHNTRRLKLTEELARDVLSRLNGNFSDRFPTYSSINTFFLNRQNLAA